MHHQERLAECANLLLKAVHRNVDQKVALPEGQYYVVVDNSPFVGQAAPPLSGPLFDVAVRVSYWVTLGDVP